MMRRLMCVAAALALAACGSAPLKAPAPSAAAPRAPVAVHPKAQDLPALPAASSGRGGYYLDDGPGDNPPPGLRDVPDAVVKAEVLSKYGNRPYVVFGKTYTPMTGDAPFIQRGVASWYGKKFQGQRTSSGELYDMYKMTAAHPTLPIPSFARITSVATGKSVVVRVNDRGPFHSSRIVDVSYTAALKLGLLGKGSHEVDVERLFAGRVAQAVAEPITTLVVENRMTQESEARAEVPLVRRPTDGFYLQLGAFGRQEGAADMRARVLASGAIELVELVQAGAVHRLYGGPFAGRDEALKAARALPSSLGIKPIVVRRSAD